MDPTLAALGRQPGSCLERARATGRLVGPSVLSLSAERLYPKQKRACCRLKRHPPIAPAGRDVESSAPSVRHSPRTSSSDTPQGKASEPSQPPPAGPTASSTESSPSPEFNSVNEATIAEERRAN